MVCDVCHCDQAEVVQLERGAVRFSRPMDLLLDTRLSVCWRCLDYRTLRQVALGGSRSAPVPLGFES